MKNDFSDSVVGFLKDHWELISGLGPLLLIAAGAYWYFCIYQSDIAKVKRGIYNFDRSRTVEEAFSANLRDLKWTTYTSKKKQTVVKAVGIWKSDMRYFSPGIIPFVIVRPGNRVEVYFVMNRDGSFSFHSGKVISASKDLGFGGDSDDTVTSGQLKFMKLKDGFLGVMYH